MYKIKFIKPAEFIDENEEVWDIHFTITKSMPFVPFKGLNIFFEDSCDEETVADVQYDFDDHETIVWLTPYPMMESEEAKDEAENYYLDSGWESEFV